MGAAPTLEEWRILTASAMVWGNMAWTSSRLSDWIGATFRSSGSMDLMRSLWAGSMSKSFLKMKLVMICP